MAKKQKSAGLVKRIVREIAKLTRRSNEPMSDDEMNDICEALLSSSIHLVHAPAGEDDEINLKLAILCRRLRDGLDPEDRGAVVNALLAESIQDDLLFASALKR